MLDAKDVSIYFLQKDKTKKFFNKNLMNKNGRSFYEGNARLNKFLHLAQNIYIAKTGEKLIEIDFYAYDNGAVIPEIQEDYQILLKKRDEYMDFVFPENQKRFLDAFYQVFIKASVDELMQLSHEDQEWIDKHVYFSKQDQKMDSLKYLNEMKIQYAPIIKVMDKIKI